MEEVKFNTGHESTINDVQFNYSGTMLATASSDNCVKVFKQNENSVQLVAELRGHNGAVTGVSWANSVRENLLLSSSYDRSVIVWRQNESSQNWEIVHQFHHLHKKSVNDVSFASNEFGYLAAAVSSDGLVSILRFQHNEWQVEHIPVNTSGLLSVSWAPFNQSPESFVVGGVDGHCTVIRRANEGWEKEELPTIFGGWVTDVAWCPNTDVKATIAAASNNGEIFIFSKNADDRWEQVAKLNNSGVKTCWRLSWELVSNILAAKNSENNCQYYKEKDGVWENISNQ